MRRKLKLPTYDEILTNLRGSGFDVHEQPKAAGVADGVLVAKYGAAAVLRRFEATSSKTPAPAVTMAVRPGILLGDEIAHILDRGFQKFLKTSRLEMTATADHLRALHRFAEELKEITGSISLYNESLGTVSDEYRYDRVKGREKGSAQPDAGH